MSEGGGVSRCCCSFIITSGFTALFMWLSLRTHRPTCSLQRFYVPALNTSLNSTTNHTILFDLKLDNNNNDKGVHYDTINLTFFYTATNGSNLRIANGSVPGFYQGHGKKARRKNQAVVAQGAPWVVTNGSRVGFKVGLATRVRYKILFWNTKREGVVVSGNVEVDGSGGKVGKKAVKLKSLSPELGVLWRVGFVGGFAYLVILLL
ncbi:Protein NDR1 [Striga hermonthica]|uniref:Protein NDR1 n=1 Tax=Striga hermonthica TaxID=68872 RepID=A0A9N7R7B7_STRHE|nr:Protein NDR1 [Striga hermonthica]